MTVAWRGDPNTTSLTGAAGKVRPTVARFAVFLGLLGLAFWLAPEEESRFVLVIIVSTLCGIFSGRRLFRMPSHVWAPLLGAVGTVLVPRLGIEWLAGGASALGANEIIGEITGRLMVPALILALAYLSLSLDASGFFDWFSLKIVRFGRGSGRRLLCSVFMGVSVMTFFTSNDIVILAVTPVLIYLGKHARLENLTPFLLAQFVAANTASMGLYIGNPTNVVIGSAVGVGFLDYAARMFVPTLAATAVAFSLVWVLFARINTSQRVPAQYHVPSEVAASGWSAHMTFKTALFVGCLLTLSVLGTPETVRALVGPEDEYELRRQTARFITWVSVSFALLAAAYDLFSERKKSGNMRARVGRMPVEIVPFFLSFCLILRGVEDAGLVERAGRYVLSAFEHGAVVGSVMSGVYGILVVNTMNNIPATIFFEKAWLGNPEASPPVLGLEHQLAALDPSYPDIFVDVCLYASNFGANLTFIGALAGLMWLGIIQKEAKRWSVGRVPSVRSFLACGACVVPIVTFATCIVIALRH